MVLIMVAAPAVQFQRTILELVSVYNAIKAPLTLQYILLPSMMDVKETGHVTASTAGPLKESLV